LPVSVVVWDQREEPRPGAEEVLCWQSYYEATRVFSLPRYLEEHAERIRSRYLAFVHDLGEWCFAGRRIIDHLEIEDGFSFWWMTQVAEKSPLKSPRIYDCLRLICLEEILQQRRPARVALVSADRALAEAVGRLCANLRVDFSLVANAAQKRKWSARSVYEALPYPLRGLLSLRHLGARWPLRHARAAPWFSGDAALFICSYFIHLDPNLCARGRFHSRQWEGLPKALHSWGVRINWLQLFLFSSVVPSVRKGVEWLNRFNANPDDQGHHAFLDGYLTTGRVAAALRMWVKLALTAWRLRGIGAAFYPRGSAAWLWPLLRDDWESSVAGPIALSSCLAVVLFDAALADIPRQKMGLYLCENQAWEKALLRAWRRHGHGEIVGVQHATAPFWHLYYFDDRRSLMSQGSGALPLPDRLAVNGADAWRAFIAAGFPAERLVEVEALRYLHLAQEPAARDGAAARQRENCSAAPSRAHRILILGDIVPASMRHLLELMQDAAGLLPPGYAFTLKPHPGYAVELAAYPGLRAAETREALGEIVGNYDVAVAANSTSAAVDAFVTGLPVVIALNGDSLNLSPLRGRPTVSFVSSAQELADSLQTIAHRGSRDERADFFFMDYDLPRWRRLLGITP
jgi:surface carbohydrate biosynthesis protein (TIGR04326 family)